MGASREEQTLALLAKFKQKLSGIKYGDDDEEKDKETKKDDDEKTEDEEEIVGDDWMKNTLVFENDAPVLAKDASSKDDDWFDIYDPRNPINKRRREQDAQEGRKREKAECVELFSLRLSCFNLSFWCDGGARNSIYLSHFQ